MKIRNKNLADNTYDYTPCQLDFLEHVETEILSQEKKQLKASRSSNPLAFDMDDDPKIVLDKIRAIQQTWYGKASVWVLEN